LRANAQVSLDGEQAHYVGRVLRLRAGDALTVFDGSGGEYSATIDKVTKQQLQLRVGERSSRNMESPLRIRLVQGISRGDRMDIVVQKATELGVHRISPVITDHSVVKLEPDRAAKRHAHWQKIAQSACEQCGRNVLPTIDAPQSLVDWFADNAGKDRQQIILRADAADALPAIDPPGNEVTIQSTSARQRPDYRQQDSDHASCAQKPRRWLHSVLRRPPGAITDQCDDPAAAGRAIVQS
jgi:16S rRNA (uracil1498-N3)-methyltransferase